MISTQFSNTVRLTVAVVFALLFSHCRERIWDNPYDPKSENLHEYGSMTDIDGNTYKTIEIGTQTWMAENLKTTKYNDGTSIPQVTENSAWTGLTSGAYCWYNNDNSNKSTYGALYNWHAVNTGTLS